MLHECIKAKQANGNQGYAVVQKKHLNEFHHCDALGIQGKKRGQNHTEPPQDKINSTGNKEITDTQTTLSNEKKASILEERQ